MNVNDIICNFGKCNTHIGEVKFHLTNEWFRITSAIVNAHGYILHPKKKIDSHWRRGRAMDVNLTYDIVGKKLIFSWRGRRVRVKIENMDFEWWTTAIRAAVVNDIQPWPPVAHDDDVARPRAMCRRTAVIGE